MASRSRFPSLFLGYNAESLLASIRKCYPQSGSILVGPKRLTVSAAVCMRTRAVRESDGRNIGYGTSAHPAPLASSRGPPAVSRLGRGSEYIGLVASARDGRYYPRAVCLPPNGNMQEASPRRTAEVLPGFEIQLPLYASTACIFPFGRCYRGAMAGAKYTLFF